MSIQKIMKNMPSFHEVCSLKKDLVEQEQEKQN